MISERYDRDMGAEVNQGKVVRSSDLVRKGTGKELTSPVCLCALEFAEPSSDVSIRSSSYIKDMAAREEEDYRLIILFYFIYIYIYIYLSNLGCVSIRHYRHRLFV